MLEQRSKGSGLEFREILQADFVLYIRDCFLSLRSDFGQSWWPDTLLYSQRYRGAFKIFSRSQSKEYFDKIKCVFSIKDKKEFEEIFEAIKNKKLMVPHWSFHSIDPADLLGYKTMATRE